MVEEGLEQLAEVRKQLKESTARIDGLRELHHNWQGAIESLLERVDKTLTSQDRALDQLVVQPELPGPVQGRRASRRSNGEARSASTERTKVVSLHPLLKPRGSGSGLSGLPSSIGVQGTKRI